MDPNAFLSWSMLLWRTRSLELRVSWTLLLWIVYELAVFINHHNWWMLPFAVVVPAASMYLHAMAHVATVRLMGGSADRTVLSVLNDITTMSVPLNPARQFAAGVAGPVVSLVLWLSSELVARGIESYRLPWDIAMFVAQTNFIIVIVNLLACAYFDGARIWRAMLWPLVGLSRAVRGTVYLSYASSVLVIGMGLGIGSGHPDMLLIMLGIGCFLTTIAEHRSIRLGFDPVMQIEFESISQLRRSRSWLSQWNARRRQRRELRHEREAAAEQEILDRLLSKVSEHGLPSLTEQERAQLQKISRKQRERQEAGMG